jgi:hypothetical protein
MNIVTRRTFRCLGQRALLSESNEVKIVKRLNKKHKKIIKPYSDV